MTPTPESGRYWSLDVPGLTQLEAEDLRSFIRDSGISDFATTVDPSTFLTLHLDRDTVNSLLRAVEHERSHVAAESPDQAAPLDGLADALGDWLRRSADGND